MTTNYDFIGRLPLKQNRKTTEPDDHQTNQSEPKLSDEVDMLKSIRDSTINIKVKRVTTQKLPLKSVQDRLNIEKRQLSIQEEQEDYIEKDQDDGVESFLEETYKSSKLPSLKNLPKLRNKYEELTIPHDQNYVSLNEIRSDMSQLNLKRKKMHPDLDVFNKGATFRKPSYEALPRDAKIQLTQERSLRRDLSVLSNKIQQKETIQLLKMQSQKFVLNQNIEPEFLMDRIDSTLHLSSTKPLNSLYSKILNTNSSLQSIKVSSNFSEIQKMQKANQQIDQIEANTLQNKQNSVIFLIDNLEKLQQTQHAYLRSQQMTKEQINFLMRIENCRESIRKNVRILYTQSEERMQKEIIDLKTKMELLAEQNFIYKQEIFRHSEQRNLGKNELERIIGEYTDTDTITRTLQESVELIEKFDYSKADYELRNLQSVIQMVASLDQSPYELRPRDTTLFDDSRATSIIENFQTGQNQRARNIQIETAKRIISRVVKKIEFTDAETNTLDNALESYKQEVETKRAQIRELQMQLSDEKLKCTRLQQFADSESNKIHAKNAEVLMAKSELSCIQDQKKFMQDQISSLKLEVQHLENDLKLYKQRVPTEEERAIVAAYRNKVKKEKSKQIQQILSKECVDHATNTDISGVKTILTSQDSRQQTNQSFNLSQNQQFNYSNKQQQQQEVILQQQHQTPRLNPNQKKVLNQTPQQQVENKRFEQILMQKDEEIKQAESKLNGTKILLSKIRDELDLAVKQNRVLTQKIEELQKNNSATLVFQKNEVNNQISGKISINPNDQVQTNLTSAQNTLEHPEVQVDNQSSNGELGVSKQTSSLEFNTMDGQGVVANDYYHSNLNIEEQRKNNPERYLTIHKQSKIVVSKVNVDSVNKLKQNKVLIRNNSMDSLQSNRSNADLVGVDVPQVYKDSAKYHDQTTGEVHKKDHALSSERVTNEILSSRRESSLMNDQPRFEHGIRKLTKEKDKLSQKNLLDGEKDKIRGRSTVSDSPNTEIDQVPNIIDQIQIKKTDKNKHSHSVEPLVVTKSLQNAKDELNLQPIKRQQTGPLTEQLDEEYWKVSKFRGQHQKKFEKIQRIIEKGDLEPLYGISLLKEAQAEIKRREDKLLQLMQRMKGHFHTSSSKILMNKSSQTSEYQQTLILYKQPDTVSIKMQTEPQQICRKSESQDFSQQFDQQIQKKEEEYQKQYLKNIQRLFGKTPKKELIVVKSFNQYETINQDLRLQENDYVPQRNVNAVGGGSIKSNDPYNSQYTQHIKHISMISGVGQVQHGRNVTVDQHQTQRVLNTSDSLDSSNY